MLSGIVDIKKLVLHEGEVLLVQIPRDDLPVSKWLEYAENIRATLSTMLLTNNIVVCNDSLKLTVIKKEE